MRVEQLDQAVVQFVKLLQAHDAEQAGRTVHEPHVCMHAARRACGLEEQRHVQRILQLLVLPGCSGSDPMCIFFGSNASAEHLQQHYLDLLAIIITCMPHQVDTAAMARGGQYALWVERHTGLQCRERVGQLAQ
jgi:hypothetical protein